MAKARTGTLDILHVEDNPAHAELVRRALRKSGLDFDIRLVMSFDEYTRALDRGRPDVVLSDNRGLDFEGVEALRLAHKRYPGVPFLFVCSDFERGAVAALMAEGAADCVLKKDLGGLSRMISRALTGEAPASKVPARHDAGPGLDFRRLFEQSPDILLVLLPDAPRFTMVGATEARLKATATTREQVEGIGLFELFPDNPDDPAATGAANLRTSLMRVLATRQPDTMAVQKYDIRGEDGSFQVKYWSPRNIPVLSDAGEVLYILHRVEDVTELVQASEAGEELRGRTQAMEREVIARSRELAEANRGLRDANVKLGELDAAKTAFFSNVSHEFRTPLTLLLGPLEELLQDTALPVAERQRLELAHHNALRLLKLVNALLDFSRIEAGRMRASFTPTDLARRTRELVSAFDSAAIKAGLSLTVNCPPLTAKAWVDEDMWEKIVLNLVSNAFKFTFEGGIEVGLAEDATHYRLSVRDTGTGIPEQELPHLFERFHRIEGARSRSHEGTGIGLSLVRELVRLHGGDITAESAPGKGSTFLVSLPKGKAHLPPEAVDETGRAPHAAGGARSGAYVGEVQHWLPDAGVRQAAAADEGPRARVLLVDDNADMRGYVAGLLRPHYRVEEAVDGQAGLESALRDPPDLVLSDVMMPRLDGFGLLHRLRGDARTRGVPVILLSARAGEESAIEGLEAGADDYLAKPFATRELLARVRTHLELARARRRWSEELERINQELESFSYSVSHDLRGPLRSINGFSQLVLEEYADKLDENGRRFLEYIRGGTLRLSELTDALLELARVARAPLKREPVDLSALAARAAEELRRGDPERVCTVEIEPGLTAEGDARLLGALVTNLMDNAWKFTGKRADARIQVGRTAGGGVPAFFVRDNGAGFDMQAARKLFTPFQRQHGEQEFEGTGIGLATVQRIVRRHGGRVWCEAAPDRGATFYFTLGEA